jgi:hypothetical protein
MIESGHNLKVIIAINICQLAIINHYDIIDVI